MDYIEMDGHKLHLFSTGDETKPKLVFMSGSGTASPVYDFKIRFKTIPPKIPSMDGKNSFSVV